MMIVCVSDAIRTNCKFQGTEFYCFPRKVYNIDKNACGNDSVLQQEIKTEQKRRKNIYRTLGIIIIVYIRETAVRELTNYV